MGGAQLIIKVITRGTGMSKKLKLEQQEEEEEEECLSLQEEEEEEEESSSGDTSSVESDLVNSPYMYPPF